MKRCYDLGPDQVESIDRLSREMGIDKIDVITGGLRLLRLAVREARGGRRIGVVTAGGVTEFVGPWSDIEPAGVA